MILKIFHITYRDEIPSKKYKFDSFRAEQFCLGKFFSILYSNPRAFR